MKEYKFEGNFYLYAKLIKRMYESALTKAAATIKLTLPEADVLCFLRENPEFDTARDVALYRDVSRPYVSKAVELLVNKGYLIVSGDKDDRRLQHLTITERGKPAAEVLHKAQYAFYDSVTAKLTQEETSMLLTLIGKCAETLNP
ncbi:MarR family winged helix-turn-helix transcriptional regulator [Parasphaerochaeta coccoides]|uniref:Regulatory protein MarR n=1 Tax=Parasphaerochaeta coccoides (strain ATCC BAA-1237 / DSM 17374 / SPN1) TaxID=760011 RepID=F4GH30_PARC1|nr:MarR family winged helix-turn-helix transcriptional regulator [Parasphaerochaeta coccoides]AEC01505.1 regulatory protein MarR [Parasphaerochaeta coccoides DSM 17374]